MHAPNSETNSEPHGSDPQSLLADLLEAARRRNLSTNSLLAYRRTWTQLVAWCSAASFDPRNLPPATAQEAYGWLGEKKGAATIKQIRAALAFAYKHWDLKNPFAKIEPPLQNELRLAWFRARNFITKFFH